MTDRSAAWTRIDPEVRAGLERYLEATNGGVNLLTTFAEQRDAEEAFRLAGPSNPYEGRTTVADHQVPDGPLVRVYRPVDNADVLPAILDIHGGGMVRGSLAGEDVNAARMAVEVAAVVVSVDYRLAPEHPYPAAIDDCYAGLQWLHARAGALGIDPARVAIYGASAGGGLAAGTALLARDRGGPPLCLQALVYPMIDDRNVTPSSHEITDLGIWDRAANLAGWAAYLGPLAGSDDVPAYAAPFRAADLRGLPSTYLDVGDVDLFRDEDVDFARRLLAAGVPTELHVYPGGIHASHIAAPTSELAIRTTGYRLSALRRALHPSG
jgi:acetyl esterase/lipase